MAMLLDMRPVFEHSDPRAKLEARLGAKAQAQGLSLNPTQLRGRLMSMIAVATALFGDPASLLVATRKTRNRCHQHLQLAKLATAGHGLAGGIL